jgi:hypothetical protein
MTASSHQEECAGRELVKKEPVRLDVAIPVTMPFTMQRMDVAPGRKSHVCLEQVNDRLKLIQILPLPSYSSQIAFETFSGKEPADSHTRSRSSRNERYSFSPAPLFASLIASIVS